MSVKSLSYCSTEITRDAVWYVSYNITRRPRTKPFEFHSLNLARIMKIWFHRLLYKLILTFAYDYFSDVRKQHALLFEVFNASLCFLTNVIGCLTEEFNLHWDMLHVAVWMELMTGETGNPSWNLSSKNPRCNTRYNKTRSVRVT